MTEAFRIEPGTYGSRVVVTSAWNPGITRYIIENDVKELYLNYAWGWKGNDIAFLNELTNLEAFFILDWTIQDIAPVHFLTHLRFVHINTYCDSQIDFTRFPDLEECFLEWHRGAESVFSCKGLRKLFLNSYGGASSQPFSPLSELRSLSLGSAAIKEVLRALARCRNWSFWAYIIFAS